MLELGLRGQGVRRGCVFVAPRHAQARHTMSLSPAFTHSYTGEELRERGEGTEQEGW